jgi:hypothetical protein
VSRPLPAVMVAVALVAVAVAAYGEVTVQITSVRAYEHGPSDVQLQRFRPRLRRLVGYRSFRVVGDERRSCEWGKNIAVRVPNGPLIQVVPKGMRDEAVLLQVKLLDGKRALVDTDIRLQNRGVVLFGVDQDTDADNGMLLIMLHAEE